MLLREKAKEDRSAEREVTFIGRGVSVHDI